MRNGLDLTGEVWDDAARGETLDRVAGGLAHDLNNLITVILGRTELLLRRGPTDAIRADLTLVRTAAEQAAALTRFLGVASAHRMVSLSAVDINQTLHTLHDRMRDKLGPRIAVLQSLASDLAPAKADPRHLEGMLLALVERAARVMPGGGKLLVETRNVTLDAAYAARRPVVRPGAYVLLAVSDTGEPMAEEVRDRVFDVHAAGPETGGDLELPMVYGLIKQCGGYVWVYGEPGRGTTFKLYLPQAGRMPGGGPHAAFDPDRLTGSETILLVEDQEAVRILAREILEEAGYTVIEAEDGGQAVLLAEALGEPAELLVSDVILPRTTGQEVAGRLREKKLLKRALFMSGYTPGALAQHEILSGSFRFLQKPFSPEALLAKVREALDEPVEEIAG